MCRTIQLTLIALLLSLVSGCSTDIQPEKTVLRIPFVSAHHNHWGWAAATVMVFDYYNIYYTQAGVVEFHDYHYGYGNTSVDEISWLLWDLGGIDSFLTGTMTFREIRSYVNSGNPILLHYGDYYNGRYALLYGYDNNGYIYLHDPDYGTRVIHYEDLFYHRFPSPTFYWTSSLIILG